MTSDTNYNPQLLKALRESNLRIEELAALCRVPEPVFIRCLTGETIINDALKMRLSIILEKPVAELWPES